VWWNSSSRFKHCAMHSDGAQGAATEFMRRTYLARLDAGCSVTNGR